ncbi:odorant receptor 284 [Tribolium castaneum]|uniref:Odorant receptor n=1 Tax=Tribolium castaneum TaxID=7070 RepID=D6WEV6_TRICA|nr:odorant receptor 284 [Tribolium castaneum]
MISFHKKAALNLDQEDKLWFLRKIYIDIFTSKISKILLSLLLINGIFLMLVQAVLFLEKFETTYLLKYVSSYSAAFFVLACLYALPLVAKTIKLKFIQQFQLWPIDSASDEIKNQIKKTAFFVNFYTVVSLAVGVMCATVFAIPTDDDTDFIFPIALMEEFIPEWKNFLLWCYRLAVFCFIVILTGPFFIVVYVIHNIRFQVLMFLHYLNNLNSGYTQRTINDKKYQNVIKKRLQFCIKRHVHITSIINNNRKELYDFIVIFAVTGVLVLISVLIFVFSFQGSFESQNIRVAVFTLACMLTFLHVIAVGQWIENVTSEVFEILKTIDWTCWNLANQKTYLIFMQNTKNHVKVQFSENISLNYELGVAMLKSVASMISVLHQLKNIDYSKSN